MSCFTKKIRIHKCGDDHDHHHHHHPHNFCEKILVDILARLPVKSVIRFMCVDKSWYSLIKSPYFITTHLAKNKSKIDHLLHYDYNFGRRYPPLGYVPKSMYALRTHDHVDDEKSICYQVPEYYTLLQPHIINADSHIYGTSNGVMCLSMGKLKHDSVVHLWNPAIRKGRTLPTSPPPPISFLECDQVALAFGFMPNTNDYKVIKILTYGPSLSVQIFSLSTNSWKVVDDVGCSFDKSVIFPLECDNTRAAFVNGAAYWIVLNDDLKLLRFDVETERIEMISLPPLRLFVNRAHRPGESIYAYGESLVFCYLNRYEASLYVWVMDTTSKGQVWKEHHHCFGVISCFGQPIGLRNNGDLLWDRYHRLDSKSVVSCSFDANREAETFLRCKDKGPVYISLFSESLVLLDD